jgi:2-polyprenyl-6-methoxyphenol hydroxylase-like FAD-dependent oxidoreductase
METSTDHLGGHAIIIGGSIAGMLAARVLAVFFERVTVLERDEIPDPLHSRHSAPQGRHAHFLLKGGEQIMENLFPGLVRQLVDFGSVPVRGGLDIVVSGLFEQPRRDLGITCHCQTRGLLEHCLRVRLRDCPNVEVSWGHAVTGLLPHDDRSRVLGVKYRHPAEGDKFLHGDLVVEAGGRGALSARWLAELGLGAPPVVEIGVDLKYATGVFRIPDDSSIDWKGIVITGKPPADARGAVVLPIEGHRWIVTLGGRFGDYPPKDYEGFIAFTQSLPDPAVYAAIKDAEMVSGIEQFGFPASMWRRYDQLAAFPERLIPVGDTLCSFNPLFGQGMTSAAQQVECLRTMLLGRSGRSDPLDGLSHEFLQSAARIVAVPWTQAAEQDFLYPATRGDRPPSDESANRYMAHLVALVQEDIDVQRQLMRVFHLMDHPATLHAEPIYSKVLARMQQYPLTQPE